MNFSNYFKEGTRMKRYLIVVLAVLLVASFAYAGVKTYQVTGPVLELTPTTITVQKGKDKWEIARDAGTKVTGDLKVGSKVTIQYEMKAASIEVKEEKKKGK
jgi:cell division protein YceG involved in septum cleavage